MTYIHTDHNKSILNRVLAGLAVASLVGIFLLVGLYNNIVDLNHNIAATKSALDAVGAKNTALNNEVVTAIHNIQSSGLAARDGLVQDEHPQYIETHPSWPIASQR